MDSTEDAREAEITKFMEEHKLRFWPGIIAGSFVEALCWGKTRKKAGAAIERWVFGQLVDDLMENWGSR